MAKRSVKLVINFGTADFTSFTVLSLKGIFHCSIGYGILVDTVQQALRVKWRVFGVFVCFDLYFVNYRSWQAEILQECAEGCIQGDLQKKIRQT